MNHNLINHYNKLKISKYLSENNLITPDNSSKFRFHKGAATYISKNNVEYILSFLDMTQETLTIFNNTGMCEYSKRLQTLIFKQAKLIGYKIIDERPVSPWVRKIT